GRLASRSGCAHRHAQPRALVSARTRTAHSIVHVGLPVPLRAAIEARIMQSDVCHVLTQGACRMNRFLVACLLASLFACGGSDTLHRYSAMQDMDAAA